MEFNTEKCEVIRVSKKKSSSLFPYKLHNVELRYTKNAKYLGIAISQDLSWNTYVENISSKANNALKFLKRNIQTQNKKKI